MITFLLSGSGKAFRDFESCVTTKDHPLARIKTTIEGVEYPNKSGANYQAVVSANIKSEDARIFAAYVEKSFDLSISL